MTVAPVHRSFRASLALAPLLVVLALTGCASGTSAASKPSPSVSSAGPCADVTVVVDFGSLDHKPVDACAPAGLAKDVLKTAHLTTVGTADYGDQVVCRVDDLPSPSAESCATLPSAAYWALWVKDSSTGTWDYAQEGVATLKLTAGQSLGLVYTVGDDTTPPQD